MNVESNSFGSVNISGTLWNYRKEPVSKGKFHLYDQSEKFLAVGKTREDGSFEVTLENLPQGQKISLIFRLCREKAAFSKTSELDPRVAKDLSFMNQRMEVEETKKEFLFQGPQKAVGEIAMDVFYNTEKVPSSYLVDIAGAGIPAEFTGIKESLIHYVDLLRLQGPDAIQKAYGVPSVPLTQENSWKFLINGICPIHFKKEGEFLVAEVNWRGYDFDKLKSLPNVKVWFKGEPKAGKPPEISMIGIQFRETFERSGKYSEYKVYLPNQVNFEEALRIANSAFFIYGETVFHLAIGHVYGAQVADKVHDYLQGTKLGELLVPHCDFIRKVTFELGKSAIFGENGILNASALSIKGIAELIDDTIAAIDPFTFAPRKPIYEEHYFAKAQKLHYGIVQESVQEFIKAHWDEIVEDWKWVHLFFSKLFKKSPIYQSWEGVNVQKTPWQDTNEIGGLENSNVPPREKSKPSDEGVRSFRPIAKDPSKPGPRDQEMIVKFATHFIHTVTLWHSWIHRSQYAINSLSPHAMDVNFSPITLSNYGKGPLGGIDFDAALIQGKVGETFKGFNVEHYALEKSEKVYGGLTRRIHEAWSKYVEVGITPLEIAYSTVI